MSLKSLQICILSLNREIDRRLIRLSYSKHYISKFITRWPVFRDKSALVICVFQSVKSSESADGCSSDTHNAQSWLTDWQTWCLAGTHASGKWGMRSFPLLQEEKENLKSVGHTSPHNHGAAIAHRPTSLPHSLFLFLFLALAESYWRNWGDLVEQGLVLLLLFPTTSDSRLNLIRGDNDSVRYSKFTTRI